MNTAPSLSARVLRYGLLSVLLTPLLFGTSLLYPFVVYRTYFFYGAVDILLVLFLYQYGWIWTAVFRNLPAGKAGRLMQAFGLLLFIKLATDLFGTHPWAGVWGNYERMMGLWTTLHLALYLVMTVWVFRTREAYVSLFRGMAGVSVIVALYGILQHAGIAFRVKGGDDRLFSTIGNPAFVAGFLLFACFFVLVLFFKEKKSLWRWLWAGAFMIDMGALYETATRGALLGVAFGVIMICAWSALHPSHTIGIAPKKIRYGAMAFIAALLFFGMGVFFFRDSSLVRSSVPLRRLADISLSDFTARDRLLLWKSALPAIRRHWIVGVGEQHIRAELDRSFDPRIQEAWFDSSHNVFLDILLAHGAVGLAAYLLFLGSLGHSLFRLRTDDSVSAMVLSAALLAYIIQSLFIFDTLVVLLPFVLLIGYAALDKEDAGVKNEKAKPSKVLGYVATFGVAALVMFGYVRGVRALALATRGYRESGATGSLAPAIRDFEESMHTAYFGYGNIASIVRDGAEAALLGGQTHDPQEMKDVLTLVAEAHTAAREKEGPSSQLFSDVAKVYLDIPGKENPYLSDGLSLLDRAIALSPRRIDLYYAKAQTLYQKGDSEAAGRLLEDVAAVFPEQRAGTYDRLFRMYDALARDAVARRAWTDAEQIFQTMLKDDPRNTRVLSNLAQTYKEMGNRAKARETAMMIPSIDPSLGAQVKTFVDSL